MDTDSDEPSMELEMEEEPQPAGTSSSSTVKDSRVSYLKLENPSKPPFKRSGSLNLYQRCSVEPGSPKKFKRCGSLRPLKPKTDAGGLTEGMSVASSKESVATDSGSSLGTSRAISSLQLGDSPTPTMEAESSGSCDTGHMSYEPASQFSGRPSRPSHLELEGSVKPYFLEGHEFETVPVPFSNEEMSFDSPAPSVPSMGNIQSFLGETPSTPGASRGRERYPESPDERSKSNKRKK